MHDDSDSDDMSELNDDDLDDNLQEIHLFLDLNDHEFSEGNKFSSCAVYSWSKKFYSCYLGYFVKTVRRGFFFSIFRLKNAKSDA